MYDKARHPERHTTLSDDINFGKYIENVKHFYEKLIMNLSSYKKTVKLIVTLLYHHNEDS